MYFYLILVLGGVLLGALINWAIYAWAMILKRSISPWMKPLEGESPRTAIDRVPIIGWYGRRRDSAVYGNGFWVRPMLMEIICAMAVPYFYYWLDKGGLTAGNFPATGWSTQVNIWFWAYGVLLTLMCIGTFIDFDEKTIPDEVTVTGTIIALLIAAFVPLSRLPNVAFGIAKDPTVAPINYASPHDPTDWYVGTYAMLVALAIFVIWIWALLPKLPVWYVGFKKSMRFMFAHALQPKRKTKCELRSRPRSVPGVTIFLGVLLLAGLVAIPLAWKTLSPVQLESLYSAFLGMAFGGGFVWAIRIIGTVALQQEAMGFGDVTLHAMIGAFLGWQAALIAFAIAPFAALIVVFLQFVLTRQNMIAFGPYLSAGTVILLFTWHSIWPKASAPGGVFHLGPYLMAILGGSLVLMAIMLATMAWMKGSFNGVEEDEN